MELDLFLEVYSENAEFIINLERLNNHLESVNKNYGM